MAVRRIEIVAMLGMGKVFTQYLFHEKGIG